LAAITHHQIEYWQSNYSLWSHTLAVTQNNFVAEDNLGGALVLLGQADEAYPHFERAAQINPRDPMSHSNLGTYFQTHERLPEAVSQYQSAVGLTSDPGLLAQTYANLGTAQRGLGEMDAARASYDESLRINPRRFNTWLSLGLLAQKQNKFEEAIFDLSRSIELQPTPQAYLELGRTFAQLNRRSEALAAYEQALKIAPDFSEAQQAIDSLQPSR